MLVSVLKEALFRGGKFVHGQIHLGTFVKNYEIISHYWQTESINSPQGLNTPMWQELLSLGLGWLTAAP